MEQSTAPNRFAPPSALTHAALGSAWSAGQSMLVTGVAASGHTPFLLTLLPHTANATVIVVNTEAEAHRLATILRRAFPKRMVRDYPAHAVYPYETASYESAVVRHRLVVLAELLAGHRDTIVVAPWRAIAQGTVAPAVYQATQRTYRCDDVLDPVTMTAQCVALGYQLVQTVSQPGDVRRHGGVVDVYQDGEPYPIRFDFFGNQLESIAHIDPRRHLIMSSLPNHTLTMRVEADWRKQPALLERLRASADLGLRESAQQEWEAFLDPFSHNHAFPGMSLLHPLLNDTPPASLLDALPADGLLVFVDPDTIVSQVTDYARRLETQRTRLIHHGMLPAWYPDVVVGARRLAHAVPTLLLAETVPTQAANFVAVQPYHHHTVASAKPMTLGQRAADAATEPPVPFTLGQYVCHIDHGIAVFEGVVTQQIAGALKPYLKLRYAGADRLYVPESQFDRVTTYGDPSNAAPQLTVLGTRNW